VRYKNVTVLRWVTNENKGAKGTLPVEPKIQAELRTDQEGGTTKRQ